MKIARIRGSKFTIDTDRATSARLARIRQRGTRPEQLVATALRSAHLRARRTNRDLPGSPDFANRSRRFSVFVHGCFWHHHAGCRKATVPTRNRTFWLAKFGDNRRRDRRAISALRKLGFRVVVIWECETSDPAKIMRRLQRLAPPDFQGPT